MWLRSYEIYYSESNKASNSHVLIGHADGVTVRNSELIIVYLQSGPKK